VAIPFLASGLLKVAAVVHAIRAGVAPYWFCIIVCVPFGELIYLGSLFAPGTAIGTRFVPQRDDRSTRQIRYAYEQTPSLRNGVALADRLFEEGRPGEAASLYRESLRRDAGFLRARFGLGLCQVELGEFAAAVESLRGVLEENRGYEEYRAWIELARALRELGRTDEAIEELEMLVSASPRLPHVVELGTVLIAAGRADEARARLQRALDDFEHAPRHVRRDGRPAARRAAELLGNLPPAPVG
jgi:hypothetical protein